MQAVLRQGGRDWWCGNAAVPLAIGAVVLVAAVAGVGSSTPTTSPGT